MSTLPTKYTQIYYLYSEIETYLQELDLCTPRELWNLIKVCNVTTPRNSEQIIISTEHMARYPDEGLFIQDILDSMNEETELCLIYDK